jgi:hypothetical protein
MADSPTKTAPLKTPMPQIPGVPKPPAAGAPGTSAAQVKSPSDPKMILGLAVLALVVCSLAAWIFLHSSRSSRTSTTPDTASTAVASEVPSVSPPVPAPPAADGSVVVAALDELSQPWASKSFQFRKRLGNELVDAVAIRLPGPAARLSSFWALSLEEPFTKCRLEYITDLSRLSSQYGYAATHPMIASSCNNAVYDPLKMGTLTGGAWVRGQVVSGSGLRPPISIDLRIDGNQLVATQIE